MSKLRKQLEKKVINNIKEMSDIAFVEVCTKALPCMMCPLGNEQCEMYLQKTECKAKLYEALKK